MSTVLSEDTILFHRTVQTLIEYLRQHPEIVLNIGMRHFPDSAGMCIAHRRDTRWPCFLRSVAEQSLRVPPYPIRRPHE